MHSEHVYVHSKCSAMLRAARSKVKERREARDEPKGECWTERQGRHSVLDTLSSFHRQKRQNWRTRGAAANPHSPSLPLRARRAQLAPNQRVVQCGAERVRVTRVTGWKWSQTAVRVLLFGSLQICSSKKPSFLCVQCRQLIQCQLEFVPLKFTAQIMLQKWSSLGHCPSSSSCDSPSTHHTSNHHLSIMSLR